MDFVGLQKYFFFKCRDTITQRKQHDDEVLMKIMINWSCFHIFFSCFSDGIRFFISDILVFLSLFYKSSSISIFLSHTMKMQNNIVEMLFIPLLLFLYAKLFMENLNGYLLFLLKCWLNDYRSCLQYLIQCLL